MNLISSFWGGGFDYKKISNQLFNLKEKSNDPNIWNDLKAKNIFKEIKLLETQISDYNRIEQSLIDLKELYFLTVNEKDPDPINQLIIDSRDSLTLAYHPSMHVNSPFSSSSV